MFAYVFEIYRFSAIDFNRFETLKIGSGECIMREYIFKHLTKHKTAFTFDLLWTISTRCKTGKILYSSPPPPENDSN